MLIHRHCLHESWPINFPVHAWNVEALELEGVNDVSFNSDAIFLWASDDLVVVFEITGASQMFWIRTTLRRKMLDQLDVVVVDDNQPKTYLAHDEKAIWARHPEQRTW